MATVNAIITAEEHVTSEITDRLQRAGDEAERQMGMGRDVR